MSLFTSNNLIPLLFVVIGLVLIYIYFRNLARVRTSAGWPAVQGTIVESRIRESRSTDEDGTPSSRYYPEIHYTYTVMGVSYQGDKIAFGPRGGGNRSSAEKVTGRYPQGSNVMVYYDPEQPDQAVLERSISKSLLVAAALFLALAAFFYLRWG